MGESAVAGHLSREGVDIPFLWFASGQWHGHAGLLSNCDRIDISRRITEELSHDGGGTEEMEPK